MKTHLIIIRHGQTDHNLNGLLQGHLDIPLNMKGIAQAQEIREKLKTESFDIIISSDLSRAYQTAKIISAGTNLFITKNTCLRERYLGVFQGQNKNSFNMDGPHIQDVESLEDMQKRILDSLWKIISEYKGKNILVVCHGGVIRNILAAIENSTPNKYHTDNLGFIELEHDIGLANLYVKKLNGVTRMSV